MILGSPPTGAFMRRFWQIIALLALAGAASALIKQVAAPDPDASRTPPATGAAESDDRACNSSQKARKTVAAAIRSAGYVCQTADSVCPYAFSEGYRVTCNHYRYVFELENHGGRWSVTAK